MLLLGPVTLKAGSVLYRFVRYYSGSEPYRRKGPPAPLPRVIGPLIMLLTACVFAEARGVSLAEGAAIAAGRHARRAREVLGGGGTRLVLLIASLLAGLIIALLTVHLAGRWEFA
jgi:hypothetical protein